MNKSPLKIVKASAGSGKTFTLALQYLTLIFAQPQHYAKILAVTFTNKATDEMKQRILSVLLFLAQPDLLEEFNPYRERILDALPLETTASLQQKAHDLYRNIIHHYDRFAVSTIDGFMQKVIRSFAFELGLDSQFALEMNIQKVKDELIQQLDELLPERPELIEFLYSLVLRQIESSKSWNYKDTLDAFAQELFKESYAEFEQVLLQFDSSQALNQQLKTYLDLADAFIEQHESTIQNISDQADQLFETHHIEIDLLHGKKRATLLKTRQFTEIADMNATLKYLDPDTKWFGKEDAYPEFKSEMCILLKQLDEHLNQNLNNYILSLKIRNHFNYISFMQEIALLLREYRSDAHKILISDTQKILSGIMSDDSHPAFIWEKIGQHYQYFLFDEFQDTSNSQWKSFVPLLENILSETPQKTERTQHLIVGDVKQAIYRWRNGDWSILHQKAEALFATQAEVTSLNDNRRSCKNIIEFNNYLYQHLPLVLQKQLNDTLTLCDESTNHWWLNKQYDHIIEQVYHNASQQFPADAPAEKTGGTVKISIFEKQQKYTISNTEEEESSTDALQILIAEIQMLCTERAYTLSDIAVLVRTNRQATEVVNALLDAQLQVVSGEALKLGQNDAIKFIINLLNALFAAPSHQSLYWAEAAWLYAKIHQKDFYPESWLTFKNLNVEQAQTLFPERFCTRFLEWKSMTANALLEQIIITFELERIPEHHLYLLKMRDVFEKFNNNGDKGIPAFLYWWQQEGIDQNLPDVGELDAIQILTVHKSKGLDFRAVFVPFCNWSIKPNVHNNLIMADMNETPFHELQLMPIRPSLDLLQTSVAKSYLEELMYTCMDALNMLYVATTRSVDYLHLITAGKKKYETAHQIGHAIIKTLKEYGETQNKYWADDFHFCIDHFSSYKTPENKQKNNITTPKKHTTSQFDKFFNTKINHTKTHAHTSEDYGREGTIMHDILARCNTVDMVKDTIKSLKKSYFLQPEEEERFEKQATSILSNSDIQMLMSTGKIFSEQEIITPEGHILRPDKIMIDADQNAIVLDYKFTQKEEKSHREQIANYKKQLQNMGYQNVKAYLYYFKNNHLAIIE